MNEFVNIMDKKIQAEMQYAKNLEDISESKIYSIETT